jgi:hypothetical protein
MTSDMDGLFETLKEFSKDCDAELLIKTAMQFKFGKSHIIKIEKAYKDNPD